MLATGELEVVLSCRLFPRNFDSYLAWFSIYLWCRIVLLQLVPALVLCVCNISLILVSCRTFRYRRHLIGSIGVLARVNPAYVSETQATDGSFNASENSSTLPKGQTPNGMSGGVYVSDNSATLQQGQTPNGVSGSVCVSDNSATLQQGQVPNGVSGIVYVSDNSATHQRGQSFVRHNPVFLPDGQATNGSMYISDNSLIFQQGHSQKSESLAVLEQSNHLQRSLHKIDGPSCSLHDKGIPNRELDETILFGARRGCAKHEQMNGEECCDCFAQSMDHLAAVISLATQENTKTTENKTEQQIHLCNDSADSFPKQLAMDCHDTDYEKSNNVNDIIETNDHNILEEGITREMRKGSHKKENKEIKMHFRKNDDTRNFVDTHCYDGEGSSLGADIEDIDDSSKEFSDIDVNWTFLYFGNVPMKSSQKSVNTKVVDVTSMSKHITTPFYTDMEDIQAFCSAQETPTENQRRHTNLRNQHSSHSHKDNNNCSHLKSSVSTPSGHSTETDHNQNTATNNGLKDTGSMSTIVPSKTSRPNEASGMEELRPSIMLVLVTSCTLLAELVVTLALILNFLNTVVYPDDKVVTSFFLSTYIMSSNLITIFSIPLNFLFFYGLSRQFRNTIKKRGRRLWTIVFRKR